MVQNIQVAVEEHESFEINDKGISGLIENYLLDGFSILHYNTFNRTYNLGQENEYHVTAHVMVFQKLS